MISYLPPATKLGQGYVFTSVCDSVNRGVCLSSCWDPPPGSRHFPRTRHPPGADTPPEQCMLGDTGNKRAVRILLECILVLYVIHKVLQNLIQVTTLLV